MKKLALYIYVLMLSVLSAGTGMAQDMQEGFAMLEKGDFAKAEGFFEKILADHPDNKTALICYGRATGLNGHTDKALSLFARLLEENPGDMEVLLNQAEAHLWNSDGHSALKAYKDILERDPSSFAGLLGMANSYSMVRNYKEAYAYINKALAAQPGNGQAAVSKKYIILGYADKLASQKQETDSALTLLAENLAANPKDQETLQLKATVHLIAGDFDLSAQTYSKLENKLAALQGRSVAEHLLGNNAQALAMAGEARDIACAEGKDKCMNANLHYVSALLWNDDLPGAGAYTDSLARVYENEPEVLATQAQVATYFGDFKKASRTYYKYLAHEPNSFKGNLGNADALHALGMDDQAYALALRTLDIYPGQKDVMGFLEKLNNQHAPKVEGRYEYGKASDGSYNHRIGLNAKVGLSPLFSTEVSYRNNEYNGFDGSAPIDGQGLYVQLGRQLMPGLKLQAKVGLYDVQSFDVEKPLDYTRTITDVSVMWKASKSQDLTFGYYSEVQDFNHALVSQDLKADHFVVKNAMFWKIPRLGWYTEVYKSFFSDGNSRHLLFTSVYRNMTKKPLVKMGLNYLNMGFEQSYPLNYFSPLSYHQVETFAGLTHTSDTWNVQLDAAGGYQFSDENTQPTWRVQATVVRSFGRLTTEVSGGHSSISAATSAGFSYTHVGFRLAYRLAMKPLFYGALIKN